MKLHKLAFYLFCFFLPSQFAFHIWPSWSLIYGIRVDYLSIKIFLTDVVFGFVFFCFLIEERKRVGNLLKRILSSPWSYFFAIFAILNIYLSKLQAASVFSWLRILFLVFVAFYVSFFFEEIKRGMFVAFLSFLALISIVSTLQFLKQESLGGIFYYLGERSFSVRTPGISLFSIAGRDVLRSYAFFSHPNSLASYVCLMALLFYAITRGFMKNFALFLSFFPIAFSFSRHVVLSLFVIFLIRFLFRRRFIKFSRMLFLALFVGSFALMAVSAFVDFDSLPKTIFERVVVYKYSGELVSNNFWTGIGLGVFSSLPISYSGLWSFQPVHNIYLLFLSETGIFGLLILFFVINKLIILLGERRELLLLLVFIGLTGFFDHYWLTLEQNRLLLFVVVGIFLSGKIKKLYGKN